MIKKKDILKELEDEPVMLATLPPYHSIGAGGLVEHTWHGPCDEDSAPRGDLGRQHRGPSTTAAVPGNTNKFKAQWNGFKAEMCSQL